MDNPLTFIDTIGMFADYFDESGNYKGTDGDDNGQISVLNGGSEGIPKNLYKEGGKTIDEDVGKSNSMLLDKVNFSGNEQHFEYRRLFGRKN